MLTEPLMSLGGNKISEILGNDAEMIDVWSKNIQLQQIQNPSCV